MKKGNTKSKKIEALSTVYVNVMVLQEYNKMMTFMPQWTRKVTLYEEIIEDDFR